jgi:hypothetical protein
LNAHDSLHENDNKNDETKNQQSRIQNQQPISNLDDLHNDDEIIDQVSKAISTINPSDFSTSNIKDSELSKEDGTKEQDDEQDVYAKYKPREVAERDDKLEDVDNQNKTDPAYMDILADDLTLANLVCYFIERGHFLSIPIEKLFHSESDNIKFLFTQSYFWSSSYELIPLPSHIRDLVVRMLEIGYDGDELIKLIELLDKQFTFDNLYSHIQTYIDEHHTKRRSRDRTVTLIEARAKLINKARYNIIEELGKEALNDLEAAIRKKIAKKKNIEKIKETEREEQIRSKTAQSKRAHEKRRIVDLTRIKRSFRKLKEEEEKRNDAEVIEKGLYVYFFLEKPKVEKPLTDEDERDDMDQSSKT